MTFCFWGNIYASLIGNTAGGGELQMALLIKELAKKGHHVAIIDFKTIEDIEYENNIKIISLSNRCQSSNVIRRYIKFCILLFHQDADVYYARIRSGVHLFGYFIAKRQHSKFILALASDLDCSSFIERLRSFYLKMPFSIFLKHIIHTEIIFKYLLYHSDLVIAQHKKQAETLTKKKIKSTIIPNVIRIPRYIVARSDDPSSIIFVGALDRRKGLPQFVKLVEACRKAEFKVIGRCRDSYSKNVINSLSILDNVEYLGSLPHEKVLKEIGKSLFLVSTSLIEGFPNVFLEAWACGIPVLSLYVDPGETINQNNLGVCFKGNLSNMIEYVRRKEVNFDKKAIIEYVKSNHDPIRNVEILIEVLKDES